ncbi:hypothetical protein U1Q18_052588 [Sarracenia purpurea var. burkii]
MPNFPEPSIGCESIEAWEAGLRARAELRTERAWLLCWAAGCEGRRGRTAPLCLEDREPPTATGLSVDFNSQDCTSILLLSCLFPLITFLLFLTRTHSVESDESEELSCSPAFP